MKVGWVLLTRYSLYTLQSVIILCFVCLGAFAAKKTAPESLYLYKGVQYDHFLSKSLKGKKLKFEGTYRKFTSLNHNALTGVIRFVPRRTGVGTLNIKDSQSRIVKKLLLTVRKTNLRDIANEIQGLLKEVDGITIKIVNNRVTVDGEILVPRDMKRIHDVIVAYGGAANSFVTLSPLAQSKMAKFIEKEINNRNVTVRVINTTFILEGFVSDDGEKKKAQAIAELYVPDEISHAATGSGGPVRERSRPAVINHIQVREPKPDGRQKLIQLVVHYVELNKDYSDNFRFQWMPQINDGTKFTFHSGSGGLGTVAGIISGTINNFLPKLNWAKAFGFARILHSANVVTEDGVAADIGSQKSIPFLATAGPNGGQKIEKTTVGLNIKIKPNIIGPRRSSVQMSIGFEVVNVVGTTGQAPITTSRRVQTTVHVQSGLSAVIGGIVSNKFFSDYNREPAQQGANPLISFLSSKKFNRSQSQFVVFVTPNIKDSASSGVERIKRKFKLSRR